MGLVKNECLSATLLNRIKPGALGLPLNGLIQRFDLLEKILKERRGSATLVFPGLPGAGLNGASAVLLSWPRYKVS